MDIASTLKGQFDFLANTLDQVMADVPSEALNKTFPGSTIGAIAGLYAHVVFGIDRQFNVQLSGKELVLDSEGWRSKLNLGPPEGGQDLEWRSNVKMDLDLFRQYAASVSKSASDYLASANDESLSGTITMRNGERPKLDFIANVALTHIPMHLGEIAAIKGMLGLKGLPF